MAESETGLSDILKDLNIKDTDFLEWFWTGSNGNDLIKKLNKYAQDQKFTDRIRREKYSPTVYGIVVNDFPFPNDHHYKLVKVGFTHRSIRQGSNNRMEQLQEQLESVIKKSNKEAFSSILFRLPIGCVDITPFYDREAQIRERVGIKVKKEKAQECNLPVPTEWVLTTQKHIDKIRERKDKACRSQNPDVIDIFKEIKAPTITQLPKEYQGWV